MIDSLMYDILICCTSTSFRNLINTYRVCRVTRYVVEIKRNFFVFCFVFFQKVRNHGDKSLHQRYIPQVLAPDGLCEPHTVHMYSAGWRGTRHGKTPGFRSIWGNLDIFAVIFALFCRTLSGWRGVPRCAKVCQGVRVSVWQYGSVVAIVWHWCGTH